MPLGPGPGPCALLKFTGVTLGAMFALLMSSLPWKILFGVRSRGVFCAKAVMPSVMAIDEAMTTRETPRLLEVLQIIL